MNVNMAAQKKKKQKTTYYQVTPQATTEQQLRIQKMRDELNAPDPNDPHVFTRYKKITYPFVVLFPPYGSIIRGILYPDRHCRRFKGGKYAGH